jgi:hypothetical protein
VESGEWKVRRLSAMMDVAPYHKNKTKQNKTKQTKRINFLYILSVVLYYYCCCLKSEKRMKYLLRFCPIG